MEHECREAGMFLIVYTKSNTSFYYNQYWTKKKIPFPGFEPTV